ncbi:hypothetical protein AB0937_13190 [Streptomyces sp. NPDC047880]|uniref:hypothetical protein n=1 Tax=Streptomyces sp. NPDC047880 TaxID=3155626 RepID=UPI003455DFBC
MQVLPADAYRRLAETATVTTHLVVTRMGADAAAAFSKPLTDEAVRAADIVITMGCGGVCPIVPGRRYPDWPVPDPEGAPLGVVRAGSATTSTPASPACSPACRAPESPAPPATHP